jgi:hypothetical protein
MGHPQYSGATDGISRIPDSREDDRNIEEMGINDVDSINDIHDYR